MSQKVKTVNWRELKYQSGSTFTITVSNDNLLIIFLSASIYRFGFCDLNVFGKVNRMELKFTKFYIANDMGNELKF